MSNQELELHLALAAVCQAATLTQEVAHKGEAPQEYVEASLHSLVITDPKSTEEVFGGLDKIRLGFVSLESQLSNKALSKDAEITRYVASILGLERKLARKPKAVAQLAERISHIQRQQSHIDLYSNQMIANLASIYSDIISPLGPKIQVSGSPPQIKQVHVQQRIRALLLTGVRAAVLWRQLGGKRRNILLQRRKILHSVREILTQLKHTH